LAAVSWAGRRNVAKTASLAPILCKHNYIKQYTKLEFAVLTIIAIIRIIKSRRMRWVGNVARMGEKRNVYRLLVGKPERKRPLGRPRRRWIDNIMIDLLEIGVNVVDWIGLAQDRYRWRALVNSVMNLRVP
jgi:hypothetical protein